MSVKLPLMMVFYLSIPYSVITSSMDYNTYVIQTKFEFHCWKILSISFLSSSISLDNFKKGNTILERFIISWITLQSSSNLLQLQAFGGFDLAGSINNRKSTSDSYIFLKEISCIGFQRNTLVLDQA